MPIEGEDEREAIVLSRVGNGLPDDLLMAQVHAVEKADGQAYFAAGGLQLSCGVNDIHRNTKNYD
jgi:hypothetical protein